MIRRVKLVLLFRLIFFLKFKQVSKFLHKLVKNQYFCEHRTINLRVEESEYFKTITWEQNQY